MSDAQALFRSLRLGPYDLPNRIVMAPMTRCRSPTELGNVPTSLAAEYYTQRSGAGLIITEGTQVSPQGVGYPDTPGIHSDAQVAGWREVTRAVHKRNGRIFAQLWHVGRLSHPALLDGGEPIAPSAIAATGSVHIGHDKVPYPRPRALDQSEIASVIGEFARAAARAMEAEFDGVELHGANGYLLEQFLYDGPNQRTDRYGGSVQNRARFVLETVDAVTAICGGERVGLRISPNSHSYGIDDSNRAESFSYLAQELNRRTLAYLHVSEPQAMDVPLRQTPRIRKLFNGVLIVNGGYTLSTATEAIASGSADAVAFAVLFLANPDLVERFRREGPLNVPDTATFYGGGARGYTDYPTLAQVELLNLQRRPAPDN
jgi:N-ethylmaleimide reductase